MSKLEQMNITEKAKTTYTYTLTQMHMKCIKARLSPLSQYSYHKKCETFQQNASLAKYTEP